MILAMAEFIHLSIIGREEVSIVDGYQVRNEPIILLPVVEDPANLGYREDSGRIGRQFESPAVFVEEFLIAFFA